MVVLVGSKKIRDHQVATDCIRIDRAIQVSPAIEVVCQVQSKTVAEVTLHAEIGLLGVGIYEILSLRIPERLEAQR